MRPYREKVLACARKHTYKYFFDKGDVAAVWERLATRYGPIRRNESMMTIEIDHAKFILRSTVLGNPITVFRKRRCTGDDVDALHAVLGFEPSAESDGR